MSRVIEIKDFKKATEFFQSFTFGQAYDQARKSYNDNVLPTIPYAGGFINENVFGGSPATTMPQIMTAFDTILGSSGNDFDDDWMLRFSSFHISPEMARQAVTYCSNTLTEHMNIDRKDAIEYKLFAWMVGRAFAHLEQEKGLSILNQIKSLMTLDPLDDGNIDMTEEITPRVEDTISDEENFKTTVSNKNNFKTTTTENDNTHGFNSSSAVPTTGSTITAEGTDVYNNSESTSEGTKLDNNSKRVISHTGKDTKTRKGFEGHRDFTRSDLIEKKMAVLRQQAMDLIFGEIRKSFFTI